MRSRLARLALLTAVTAAVAMPAWGQWYEAYERAEAALAAEDWGEAVRQLNAALEEQPESGANQRTYGMRFVAYFPYLKLGIAYYHLGQHDAALEAFDTELRQGAIERSAADRRLLDTYRQRIASERASAEEAQRRRADTVVADGLAAARREQERGRPQEALAAVDRVLAVAPDHAEALGLRRTLLAALAAAERQRSEADRYAELMARAAEDRAAGRHAQAAAGFREALEARPGDAAASRALAAAQAALREEAAGRRDEEERRDLMAASLRRAEGLARGGDLTAALNELQTALALEPENRQALALQRRWLAAQAEQDAASEEDETVAALLIDAEERLLGGDFEGALRTANRVLAVDPGNEAALRQVSRGYARLSDVLLREDDAPPVVLLDTEPAADGAPLRVRRPALLLTGTAYDGTPVSVRVVAAGESDGTEDEGADSGLGAVPLGEIETESRELEGVWITTFRWRHELPAGVSRFAVEAVDRHGNRTRALCVVDYTVPFLRSPWFPGSVSAALGLLVVGFVGLRARRRRRLLRGRFNPYTAGAPILEQERFFGRQQLLDYVLRRISNNSIMLYGERRIGKTSFQHRLKRCLSELDDPVHEFYPVFVDLQGTPQERFFPTLAAELFHELSPKLDGIEPHSPPAGREYGYRDFARDLQRVLAELATKTRKKVKLVLLIDEVDELNDYDPRVNQRLRSLFMRAFAENLVAVVSGVSIKKQWEREGSPWYNFFQEIEVTPLDPDEARALIEAPVRGVFRFEDGVADRIVERTHAKPYLIQRLCSSLVDRMHEEGRQTATLEDVEAAARVEGL